MAIEILRGPSADLEDAKQRIEWLEFELQRVKNIVAEFIGSNEHLDRRDRIEMVKAILRDSSGEKKIMDGLVNNAGV